MTNTIKEHDFIELNYTGKLTDGTVFDTTIEAVAKENGFNNDKAQLSPAIICVGEKQVLPGLDAQLIGKETGKDYDIELNAEEAFGKRDVKKMRIMPISAFKEHNMNPQPGMQIDADGQVGTVSRVSGGRVIVNFNHPLAGRDVVYTVNVLRVVTDPKEKIQSFLNSAMRMPKDKIEVDVKEDKAEVKLPMDLPEQFTDAIGKKLAELVKLKEVKFVKAAEKKETAEKKAN